MEADGQCMQRLGQGTVCVRERELMYIARYREDVRGCVNGERMRVKPALAERVRLPTRTNPSLRVESGWIENIGQ